MLETLNHFGNLKELYEGVAPLDQLMKNVMMCHKIFVNGDNETK